MTAAARNWVREHSPARGRELVVLAELARWAPSDDGLNVWISHDRLAHEVGRSRRTVQRALAALERDDRIRRHVGGRDHCDACRTARRGIVVFDVVIPAQPDAVDAAQMTLLAGARPAPDEGEVARHFEGVARHGDAGTCATVTHKRVNGDVHQQQDAREEISAEISAAVDRVFAAIRPTRLADHLNRHAIEGVAISYSAGQIDDALLTVVALAGDERYIAPKGGIAVMLLHELRRMSPAGGGEPAYGPRAARRPGQRPSGPRPAGKVVADAVSDRRSDALSRLSGLGASA